jgi:hypothetical protein
VPTLLLVLVLVLVLVPALLGLRTCLRVRLWLRAAGGRSRPCGGR